MDTRAFETIYDQIQEAAERCARLSLRCSRQKVNVLCTTLAANIEARYGGDQFIHQIDIRDRMLELSKGNLS